MKRKSQAVQASIYSYFHIRRVSRRMGLPKIRVLDIMVGFFMDEVRRGRKIVTTFQYKPTEKTTYTFSARNHNFVKIRRKK